MSASAAQPQLVTTAIHGATAAVGQTVGTSFGAIPAALLKKDTNDQALKLFAGAATSDDPHHPHVYEYNGVQYSSFLHGETHHSQPVGTSSALTSYGYGAAPVYSQVGAPVYTSSVTTAAPIYHAAAAPAPVTYTSPTVTTAAPIYHTVEATAPAPVTYTHPVVTTAAPIYHTVEAPAPAPVTYTHPVVTTAEPIYHTVEASAVPAPAPVTYHAPAVTTAAPIYHAATTQVSSVSVAQPTTVTYHAPVTPAPITTTGTFIATAPATMALPAVTTVPGVEHSAAPSPKTKKTKKLSSKKKTSGCC